MTKVQLEEKNRELERENIDKFSGEEK